MTHTIRDDIFLESGGFIVSWYPSIFSSRILFVYYSINSLARRKDIISINHSNELIN